MVIFIYVYFTSQTSRRLIRAVAHRVVIGSQHCAAGAAGGGVQGDGPGTWEFPRCTRCWPLDGLVMAIKCYKDQQKAGDLKQDDKEPMMVMVMVMVMVMMMMMMMVMVMVMVMIMMTTTVMLPRSR